MLAGLGLSCTYLGEEVLVVVNPFKATPEPRMAGFANREPCDARPHPFAVADRAYRRMRQTGRAQVPPYLLLLLQRQKRRMALMRAPFVESRRFCSTA